MEELDLVTLEDGTRVRLRVRPGAARNRVAGVHAGALRVHVTAQPEKGKANRAVLRLLAKLLEVPRSSVRLAGGAASRDKAVDLPLPPRELLSRLRPHLPVPTPGGR